MANIVREEVTVGRSGSGAVRVEHTQIHDDGIDMGGVLVFEAAAAAWLADEVARAADAWGYTEVDTVKGVDHFTVYVGGSDMQPFVHVHNQRDPSAPDGRVYTLGMTADTARDLAVKLAAL